jgi:hypothetical protein
MMLTSCELFINEPDEGEGRIILVGVGLRYSGVTSLNELNGTVNDVKMLSYALQTLSDNEDKSFYWIPLTDEANSNTLNYATKENFINAINYLKNDSSATKPLILANPKDFVLATVFDENNHLITGVIEKIELNSNDILIFQYSGHGKSDSGDLFLRSKADITKRISLDLEGVYDLFRNLPCKSLLLLDSCFSGNAIPVSDTTISTNDPRVKETWFFDYFNFLINDISDEDSSFVIDNDLYILTAATSNTESYESFVGDKIIGAFTYSVLQAFGWDIDFTNSNSIESQNATIPAKTNGKITLDNIYEYIKDLPHEKHEYDARIIGGRYDLVLFDF